MSALHYGISRATVEQILLDYFKLDGSRPIQVDPQAKIEFLEDHSRYGLNDRFAVIKPTSYYAGASRSGLGLLSHSLYLVDVDGIMGGFVQVVSKDNIFKYGGLWYDSAVNDRAVLYSLGADLALGVYDGGFAFRDLITLKTGAGLANCYATIHRAGHIIPATTLAYDFGDVTKYFRNGFVEALYAAGVYASSIYPTNVCRIPDVGDAIAGARNMRYNAATDKFEIYDGAVWHEH